MPFRQITAITYGNSDESFDQYSHYSHHALDVYCISLRLIHNAEIHLFRFVGEGVWENNSPCPDWMFSHKRAIDFMGTQDRDSLALVEVLSDLIGVRIRPLK